MTAGATGKHAGTERVEGTSGEPEGSEEALPPGGVCLSAAN